MKLYSILYYNIIVILKIIVFILATYIFKINQIPYCHNIRAATNKTPMDSIKRLKKTALIVWPDARRLYIIITSLLLFTAVNRR